ncbi:unnamed protein product, partial [marine sediment metagenome]
AQNPGRVQEQLNIRRKILPRGQSYWDQLRDVSVSTGLQPRYPGIQTHLEGPGLELGENHTRSLSLSGNSQKEPHILCKLNTDSERKLHGNSPGSASP